MTTTAQPPAPDLTREVCDAEPAVGVYAMPFVPASFAYGNKCLIADAHPIGMLAVNTAMCGGLDMTNDRWQQMVRNTLQHLNYSLTKFKAEVQMHADEIGLMQ